MGYYVDLESIPIMQYKQSIKTGYLPPSRKMLKENIDERFDIIEKQGICTAAQLLTAVKTKNRTEDFIAKTGIDHEYITLLSREIRSLIKKPTKLSEFSMISEQTQKKLAEAGIKNTTGVYDKVLSLEDRRKLAQSTGVSEEEIELVARLTDLCRIRWVNHTFAQILYDLGYKSAKDVSEADAETLHQSTNVYIKENGIYNGSIGLNDIRICIEAAGTLEHELK